MRKKESKNIVYLDTGFVSEKEANLAFSARGFLQAVGLFETMRSQGNKIVYLGQHLARIKQASGTVGIKFSYSPLQLKKTIKELVRLNCLSDACVRLIFWEKQNSGHILISAKKYTAFAPGQYRRGFQANISRFRSQADSVFARLKTTERMLYELSYRQAKAKGFDEAVLLNHYGYLAETTRSNIFFIKDNGLFTPAPECGCLAGITRKAVFDLAREFRIKVYEGNFTLRDLITSDEAFLTNSLVGIMPLVKVEKENIGNGLAGRLTGYFIRRYNSLLKNGT